MLITKYLNRYLCPNHGLKESQIIVYEIFTRIILVYTNKIPPHQDHKGLKQKTSAT